VTVTGTEYAFRLPADIAPGLAAFTFENHGKVRHEMNLFRLKVGVAVDSFRRVERGPNRRALIEGGGILVAEPGERTPDRLLVDLRPGQTYIVVCNLQDGPDQPRHETLGMMASFVVK
jgi:hypothetical protein